METQNPTVQEQLVQACVKHTRYQLLVAGIQHRIQPGQCTVLYAAGYPRWRAPLARVIARTVEFSGEALPFPGYADGITRHDVSVLGCLLGDPVAEITPIPRGGYVVAEGCHLGWSSYQEPLLLGDWLDGWDASKAPVQMEEPPFLAFRKGGGELAAYSPDAGAVVELVKLEAPAGLGLLNRPELAAAFRRRVLDEVVSKGGDAFADVFLCRPGVANTGKTLIGSPLTTAEREVYWSLSGGPGTFPDVEGDPNSHRLVHYVRGDTPVVQPAARSGHAGRW